MVVAPCYALVSPVQIEFESPIVSMLGAARAQVALGKRVGVVRLQSGG